LKIIKVILRRSFSLRAHINQKGAVHQILKPIRFQLDKSTSPSRQTASLYVRPRDQRVDLADLGFVTAVSRLHHHQLRHRNSGPLLSRPALQFSAQSAAELAGAVLQTAFYLAKPAAMYTKKYRPYARGLYNCTRQIFLHKNEEEQICLAQSSQVLHVKDQKKGID
jgi:hypothetical protein